MKTIRDNRQWYGWWRSDDFISIFEIWIRANDICRLVLTNGRHVWHVSGWRHSVSPSGATCHPLSRSHQQKLPSSGPSQVIPPSLAPPDSSPSHELWQYPDIIYLTKANNRSTLQSNWESERGTREFDNWFNASPHIKAKDFAKRWGQKQPVHFIICQTAPDVRNEKFLTKRAKLLSAVKLERWAGEWKLSNFAFLVCWF